MVIGFTQARDRDLATAYLSHGAHISALGPSTARAALTREQVLEMAGQPGVKYLKLVERLTPA